MPARGKRCAPRVKCLIQSDCTIRQRFDLIEFIYPHRPYANSRSAKFAKRDWIQSWLISVKIKQAGSQATRSERLFFKTGAPVMSGAFERIWADTPCRRPIQTVAFLSFRIVHHRRNLDAFVRRHGRDPP
jgi:hypothetical protein